MMIIRPLLPSSLMVLYKFSNSPGNVGFVRSLWRILYVNNSFVASLKYWMMEGGGRGGQSGSWKGVLRKSRRCMQMTEKGQQPTFNETARRMKLPSSKTIHEWGGTRKRTKKEQEKTKLNPPKKPQHKMWLLLLSNKEPRIMESRRTDGNKNDINVILNCARTNTWKSKKSVRRVRVRGGEDSEWSRMRLTEDNRPTQHDRQIEWNRRRAAIIMSKLWTPQTRNDTK